MPMRDPALVRVTTLKLQNRELMEDVRRQMTLKKGYRREWQKRGRELTDAHATIETATQEKLMSDYKLQEMQNTLDAERVASSQLRAEHSELKRHLQLLGRAPPPAPPPAPLPQTGDAEPSAKRTRTGL